MSHSAVPVVIDEARIAVTREKDVIRWLLEREIVAPLAPEDFYRHPHRVIWQTALDLQKAGRAVDYLSVKAELERRGQLDAVGPIYLHELSRESVRPSDAAIQSAAAEVRQFTRGQQLREIVGLHAADTSIDVERLLSDLTALAAPGDIAFEKRVQSFVDLERAKREARRRVDADDRGGTAIPPAATLQEFLSGPDEPIIERVVDLQPAGTRVILAAKKKSGKTTIRDNFLRCLVDGGRFLGQYDVHPVQGNVALLDLEMSRRQLRHWLRDQGIRHTARVVVFPLRGRLACLDLLDPHLRRQWAALLREHSVKYLILDCLRPLLDALGLSEKDEAGRLLVQFDALLTEAEIPEALLVHHMGHVGERSRGDSRLGDWPDVEWQIVRKDEDAASPRFFKAYGRDVDVPEALLNYDKATRVLTVAGGSRQDEAHREALDAVLEALDEASEPLSGRRLWAALQDSKHPRAAVYAAIDLGLRTHALEYEDGPRNSRLYRRGVSQCSGVSGQRSGTDENECPAARIGRDTRTHLDGSFKAESDGTLVRSGNGDARY